MAKNDPFKPEEERNADVRNIQQAQGGNASAAFTPGAAPFDPEAWKGGKPGNFAPDGETTEHKEGQPAPAIVARASGKITVTRMAADNLCPNCGAKLDGIPHDETGHRKCPKCGMQIQGHA